MWKKEENETAQPTYTPKSAVTQLKERATIGTSILIKGELEGEEDLMVQGRVEGKIDLKDNNLTIGERGRLKAEAYAKVISIEGRVEGNLFGKEKIVIRKAGRVKGNLKAPLVSLEEGATFKGSIDMDFGEEEEAEKKPVAAKPETGKPADQKAQSPASPKPPLGLAESTTPGGQ